MSNPAPLHVVLECRLEDPITREAVLQAFEGYCPGDEPEVRSSFPHHHGVDIDTPFDLGDDWHVESAQATTDGSCRLTAEWRDDHTDEFVESFLLVADAVGGYEVAAEVSGGEGGHVHVRVVNGRVVYDTRDDAALEAAS